MSFNPKRHYSAVAVFSDDLERVVLIHKLKPTWQAGKANLPGGKVEAEKDYINADVEDWQGTYEEACNEVYRRCAVRELREETGLDVAAAALKLFCRLCFKTPEGDAAECCFFAARGDVDAARTVEAERVFVGEVAEVIAGGVSYHYWSDRAMSDECGIIPTMPNLPYIVAMARQCLRGGDTTKTWPLTVYENGATP